jgi:hypothetical protein
VKASLSVCGVAAATLLMAAEGALSQDKKGKPEHVKADEPGPAHKELARLAGNYDTVSRFRFSPSDEPMESKGTARITTALDGRFLLEENTGTLLGQAHNGLRLIGYNNGTKQYEATWTYSLSTAIMTMHGTSKDNGKTIDWTASYTNEKGEKQTLFVSTRNMDDDRFVVELFGKTPDGKKWPTVETTYTRRK